MRPMTTAIANFSSTAALPGQELAFPSAATHDKPGVSGQFLFSKVLFNLSLPLSPSMARSQPTPPASHACHTATAAHFLCVWLCSRNPFPNWHPKQSLQKATRWSPTGVIASKGFPRHGEQETWGAAGLPVCPLPPVGPSFCSDFWYQYSCHESWPVSLYSLDLAAPSMMLTHLSYSFLPRKVSSTLSPSLV